jgi:hypothetical protein
VIAAMPRPRPPRLQRQVTRHGKAVWYVRIGKGPRIRIRSAFGTPEFDTEYQAAVSGVPGPKKRRAGNGNTRVAYRPVSRDNCLVQPLPRYPPAARQYFSAGSQIGWGQVTRLRHESGD